MSTLNPNNLDLDLTSLSDDGEEQEELDPRQQDNLSSTVQQNNNLSLIFRALLAKQGIFTREELELIESSYGQKTRYFHTNGHYVHVLSDPIKDKIRAFATKLGISEKDIQEGSIADINSKIQKTINSISIPEIQDLTLDDDQILEVKIALYHDIIYIGPVENIKEEILSSILGNNHLPDIDSLLEFIEEVNKNKKVTISTLRENISDDFKDDFDLALKIFGFNRDTTLLTFNGLNEFLSALSMIREQPNLEHKDKVAIIAGIAATIPFRSSSIYTDMEKVLKNELGLSQEDTDIIIKRAVRFANRDIGDLIHYDYANVHQGLWQMEQEKGNSFEYGDSVSKPIASLQRTLGFWKSLTPDKIFHNYKDTYTDEEATEYLRNAQKIIDNAVLELSSAIVTLKIAELKGIQDIGQLNKLDFENLREPLAVYPAPQEEVQATNPLGRTRGSAFNLEDLHQFSSQTDLAAGSATPSTPIASRVQDSFNSTGVNMIDTDFSFHTKLGEMIGKFNEENIKEVAQVIAKNPNMINLQTITNILSPQAQVVTDTDKRNYGAAI